MYLAVALLAVWAGLLAQTSSMNDVAERYVRLVLAVGQDDRDYVDAFYGPPAWKDAAAGKGKTLAELGEDARRLIKEVPPRPTNPADPLEPLRVDYLKRQLESVEARIRMLSGTKFRFDEESRALYDAVAPEHDAVYFESALKALEPLLPAPGSLIERYERFRQAFVIPSDRLSSVFDRAVAECRTRTTKHVALPDGESFKVEYVTGKTWGGYNWYQGNFHSLIQVNTDLPIYIDRAVDLACHEEYPGHHVYNMLLEKHLVRDRGWLEYTVYPLFSPQSLIAEGTANYGIEVAFPGDERLAFERDVLFPLAGLEPSRAETYHKVQTLVDQLSYAVNEAARRYLNGQWSREQAVDWLTTYALMDPARAEQRTRFMDQDPQLRHQLQPGEGPREGLYRGPRRRKRGAAVGGVRRPAVLAPAAERARRRTPPVTGRHP